MLDQFKNKLKDYGLTPDKIEKISFVLRIISVAEEIGYHGAVIGSSFDKNNIQEIDILVKLGFIRKSKVIEGLSAYTCTEQGRIIGLEIDKVFAKIIRGKIFRFLSTFSSNLVGFWFTFGTEPTYGKLGKMWPVSGINQLNHKTYVPHGNPASDLIQDVDIAKQIKNLWRGLFELGAVVSAVANVSTGGEGLRDAFYLLSPAVTDIIKDDFSTKLKINFFTYRVFKALRQYLTYDEVDRTTWLTILQSLSLPETYIESEVNKMSKQGLTSQYIKSMPVPFLIKNTKGYQAYLDKQYFNPVKHEILSHEQPIIEKQRSDITDSEQPTYFSVSVIVKDEKSNPARGVSVKLDSFSQLTDSDGAAKLSVPKGEYQLNIFSENAQPVVRTLYVDQDVTENISLTILPPLAPIRDKTNDISILLGSTNQGEKVFWRPFEETNQHLLVCGSSGSGKTQSLKTIVRELEQYGISSIILDFKGGTFKLGNIVDVNRVTINPLELDSKESKDITPWSPKDKALSVSHAFDKIFKLGDQQRAKLADAFLESYHSCGITEDDSESWAKPAPSLDDVEKILDNMADDPKIRNTIITLKGRLQTILWKKYFSSPTTLPLSQIVTETTTVDFSSVRDNEVKTAISEVILQKLLGFMYIAGPSRKPRFFIIIDEGHRLAYNESALDLLARESREYGVGVIVASQLMKDFKKEILGNLSTIISYQIRPSEEARYVAQQLGEPITEKYLLQDLTEPFKGVVKLGRAGIPRKFRFTPYYERSRSTDN